MAPRRLALVVGLVVFVAAVFWWQRPAPREAVPALVPALTPSAAAAGQKEPSAAAAPVSPPAGLQPQAATSLFPDHVSVALDLNSPRFNLTHDLQLLNDLFIDWRLMFPRAGHPFGENAEITAALSGQNPLGIRLFPPDHPAINAAGELCDRWGTPFRFHALASDRMEVQSAGPDRKFATPDDGLFTPPPPPGGEPPR